MMTSDQFSRLFSYMNERFDAVEACMEAKADKTDIDRIVNMIDGLYDRIDILNTEYVSVMSHQRRMQGQVNHHETRIAKLEQA